MGTTKRPFIFGTKIDRVFPFDQTNEGFTYLETGRAKGKVVVDLESGR